MLVSEAVRKRVEDRFRFKGVASVIAKGMTTETRVHALVEAVAATLQAVTKLKGAVKLVAPGSLPNDGKVIADERPVG